MDIAREGARRSRRQVTASAAIFATMVALVTSQAHADVDLKFYGDTSFGVRNHSDVSNSFAAAELELFPTATVDRASFLAELMAEAGEDNVLVMDLERVQVAYLFADWLRVRTGRMHTAFGYYNDGYHHAKFFQLTTGRPQLVSFEDEGGLLAAHLVGVGVDGQVSLGEALDLHYDVEAGNGRGNIVDEVTIAQAKKSNKMFNVRLRLLPSFLEGLIVGANFTVDEIPPALPPESPGAPPPPGIPNRMRELVWGAHVAYREHHVHVIAEGAAIIHKEEVTNRTYRHYGGFVEIGYALGDFLPYARYEHIKFASIPDPFFLTGSLGSPSVFRDTRVGLKWVPTENIALKLEGRTTKIGDGDAIMAAELQCAFGF
jgi:hypothetical protein